MGNLRLPSAMAMAMLACGCGGSTSQQPRYTGAATLSATGSWNFTDDQGSTLVGTETFDVQCAQNGDGTGELTGSFMMHQELTEDDGQTSVTDVSATPDISLTDDNPGCVLGTGDGNDFGVQILLADFNVTGQTVADGVTLPIDEEWAKEDLAEAGTGAETTFSQPASASAGTYVGMFTYNSGDLVGGDPSMVVEEAHWPWSIPVTISWSYSKLQ